MWRVHCVHLHWAEQFWFVHFAVGVFIPEFKNDYKKNKRKKTRNKERNGKKNQISTTICPFFQNHKKDICHLCIHLIPALTHLNPRFFPQPYTVHQHVRVHTHTHTSIIKWDSALASLVSIWCFEYVIFDRIALSLFSLCKSYDL